MLKSIRWKVMVSLLLSVSIPIFTSIYFFEKGILRAYSVALNEDVREALKTSIDSQRLLLQHKKKGFKNSFDMHIIEIESKCVTTNSGEYNPQCIEKFLSEKISQEENLFSICFNDEKHLTMICQKKDERAFNPSEWRKFKLKKNISTIKSSPVYSETYIIPWAVFEKFEKTGEVYRTFEASMKSKRNITGIYKKVYIFIIAISVIVALALSLLYSRGFGIRIIRIAKAATEIARGNLNIEIDDKTKDEVGELGRTFNNMIKEIKESRERINYLQKISAWQEMARRLAHEIKNPLTPIQLSIQQLKSKYNGSDKNYENILNQSIQIVMEEIEELKKLVNEFSSFARLPGVNTTPVMFMETIREILAYNKMVCEQKKVELKCIYKPRKDFTVNLDRMMIKRVLDNLILNAIQSIENGRKRRCDCKSQIVVEVDKDPLAGNVNILVADDGEGIAEQDRGKIFVPYFTKKKGGAGLGLAIVKKVILEHGGNIVLANQVAVKYGLKGAAFIINLPLPEEERGKKTNETLSNQEDKKWKKKLL